MGEEVIYIVHLFAGYLLITHLPDANIDLTVPHFPSQTDAEYLASSLFAVSLKSRSVMGLK